ncbi:MAG: hypothetical protein R3222_10760 [Balneolaceae bacterium]|nr:hypothetical protein [Balneolaceae bacterium]
MADRWDRCGLPDEGFVFRGRDGPAGKNTLGVLLGEDALRWEYLLMLLLAAFIPFYMYLYLGYTLFIFLPILSLPFALYLLKVIWTETEKSRLNKTLEQTAQFMTFYGILLSAGIIAG